MSGGIQKGTTATSINSIKIDTLVKQASLIVYEHLKKTNPNITYQRKIKPEQLPHNVGSMEPDGGLWFYKDTLIMVVEAKYQGCLGNAIERWYKNHSLARLLNPQVSYLTFASGCGVNNGKPIWHILHAAHSGKYNEYQPMHNTAFLSVDGFSLVDLCNHIIELFNQTIERIEND